MDEHRPEVERHMEDVRRLRREALGVDCRLELILPRSRNKPGDPLDPGVPVEPNRPNDLSGGAAAALDFSDEG